MGARGPNFLSVYDPVIAVLHAFGAKGCKVRAARWLTEQLAPDFLTARQRRHKALILFFGRPGHHRGRAHPLTNGEDPRWGIKLRFFLIEDHLLDCTRIATAVGFRPPNAGPAGIMLFLLPKLGATNVIHIGKLSLRWHIGG